MEAQSHKRLGLQTGWKLEEHFFSLDEKCGWVMGKTSGLEIYKELNWEVSDRLNSLMDRRTWTSLEWASCSWKSKTRWAGNGTVWFPGASRGAGNSLSSRWMAGLSGWALAQLVFTVVPRESMGNGVMDSKITLGEIVVLSVSLDSTPTQASIPWNLIFTYFLSPKQLWPSLLAASMWLDPVGILKSSSFLTSQCYGSHSSSWNIFFLWISAVTPPSLDCVPAPLASHYPCLYSPHWLSR